MSTNYTRVVAFLLLLSIALHGQTTAQEAMPKADFGNGAFDEVAPEMQALLQLTWDGDNLTIKQDWAERLKKKRDVVVDEEERTKMIDEFVKRGLPEEQAVKMAEQLLTRGINPFGRNDRFRLGMTGRNESQVAVDKAFFKISEVLGSRSTSRSGGRISFVNAAMAGEANTKADDLRFNFRELGGDQRTFELSENSKGIFKFEFSFGELFVRFLQSKHGATQLIWIAGDKVNVYTGDSFSDFVKRNPQAVEKLLLPLMNRLGIEKPISRRAPEVLSAAIRRLQSQAASGTEVLKGLFKDLDADNYQARNEASEKLTAGYDQWSAKIKEYSTNKELSVDARFRLKEIIEENSTDNVADFIKEQALLESPDFLVVALEFANDQQKTHVVKQLEKVTKQSHGTDVQAWKDWLKANE